MNPPANQIIHAPFGDVASGLRARIDVMLMRAVMALVDEKERHLREAAERECRKVEG